MSSTSPVSDSTAPLTEEELVELKDEVEVRTVKQYKIREPRQNINDVLLIGAIQDAPTSVWEALKMGFMLAIMFLLSFGMYYVLFFQYPSKNYKGKSDLFKPKASIQQQQKPKAYQPLLQDEPLKPLYEDEF